MTELIEKWRSEFGLTNTGDWSQANLDLFIRLFLEEFEEVLLEIVDDTKPQVQLLQAALKNIKSNPNHFAKHIDDVDKVKLENELTDLEYIVHGHGWNQLALDKKAAHIRTFASNMSKTCQTEEEAIKSCTKDNPHLKVDPKNVHYKMNDSGLYLIYDKGTGKILKGINFKRKDEID